MAIGAIVFFSWLGPGNRVGEAFGQIPNDLEGHGCLPVEPRPVVKMTHVVSESANRESSRYKFKDQSAADVTAGICGQGVRRPLSDRRRVSHGDAECSLMFTRSLASLTPSSV